MTPKLTPTTNDAVHGMIPDVTVPMPNGKVKIVPAHEPLPEEPWNPANIAQLKEQKVNVGASAEPQVLKIALVGTAPSSRSLAPFADPSWKIWGCSAGNMNQLPRVDAWFEIHSNLLWPENEHYGRPYIEWLGKQKFPVYMQDRSMVPNAIPLPKDELVHEFGPFFFTSSFAWMLAMAMKEGAKEIALYGIDMASRDEYILQRPGAYFFFMEAKRRGIKIIAPNESDILQPPALYGFSDSTPFGRKIAAREKELKERVASMRSQRDSLNQNITYLEGAIEDMDYIKSIWSGIGDKTQQ